jgi:TPR repeat protein
MKANRLALLLLFLTLGIAAAQQTNPSSGDTASGQSAKDGLHADDGGPWEKYAPLKTRQNAKDDLDAVAQQTNSLSSANETFETVKAKADQGDVAAQRQLAWMYDTGNSVPKNPTEAMKWYRKAAEQGDAEAQWHLGAMYKYGLGVHTNKTEAARWYQKAAESYRKAAEQGNARAQSCLGDMYAGGDGVPRDYAEAAKWYRKAAEQGNEQSQYWLAEYYYDGKGIQQDYKEAAKWYRKAAEQGDMEAQCQLALCYYEGKGVPQDQQKAQALLDEEFAKEKGPVEAYLDALGSELLNGWPGRALDVGGGIWVFTKLAETRDTRYQEELALIYSDGTVVPKDYTEAAKWFRKAAEQGDSECQYNLGTMYDNGQGVPQDFVQAYKWYNLAAAQGETNAVHRRDVIVRFMTTDQIAEAQELSREFKPHTESGSANSSSPDTPTASGTGFFITDDGYLITNHHVVMDTTKVRLLTRSGMVDAKVVQVDTANDLALLKANGTFSPLPIAASRSVSLGATVATVGFPDIGLQGFAPKLAKGEIASLSGAADDPRYFQISVPVQPGNSGGALVDQRGNVVGIVSAKLSARAALAESGALPENVNYAVKSSFLLGFLESVPDVSAKLKEPNTQEEKFEDVVKSAQGAAVLVLVY